MFVFNHDRPFATTSGGILGNLGITFTDELMNFLFLIG